MKKKQKKIKLQSIPRINRRLFTKWAEIVRNRAGIGKCEYCEKSVGEIGHGANPITKIDSHHLVSRKVKDCPLKFEILNGVAACPFCHKFGFNSFHNSPITTMSLLIKNHPERFNYVLDHFNDRIDLQNRDVLKEIEKCLDEKKSLDINSLKEIEAKNPRIKKEKKIKKTLFDEDTPDVPDLPTK